MSASCQTCGAKNGACLKSCAVCGYTACGGIGVWACHVDTDETPVCRGKCWRAYSGKKEADKTELMWLAALKRWNNLPEAKA